AAGSRCSHSPTAVRTGKAEGQTKGCVSWIGSAKDVIPETYPNLPPPCRAVTKNFCMRHMYATIPPCVPHQSAYCLQAILALPLAFLLINYFYRLPRLVSLNSSDRLSLEFFLNTQTPFS